VLQRSWNRRPSIPVALRARCHTARSVAVRKGYPVAAREHEVVAARAAPCGEVLLELRDDHFGDRRLAPAGVGLRRPEHERAVSEPLIAARQRSRCGEGDRGSSVEGRGAHQRGARRTWPGASSPGYRARSHPPARTLPRSSPPGVVTAQAKGSGAGCVACPRFVSSLSANGAKSGVNGRHQTAALLLRNRVLAGLTPPGAARRNDLGPEFKSPLRHRRFRESPGQGLARSPRAALSALSLPHRACVRTWRGCRSGSFNTSFPGSPRVCVGQFGSTWHAPMP
jgi:hypothetical protein